MFGLPDFYPTREVAGCSLVMAYCCAHNFPGGIITTLVTPDELSFIKAVGDELQVTMLEGEQPGPGLPLGEYGC